MPPAKPVPIHARPHDTRIYTPGRPGTRSEEPLLDRIRVLPPGSIDHTRITACCQDCGRQIRECDQCIAYQKCGCINCLHCLEAREESRRECENHSGFGEQLVLRLQWLDECPVCLENFLESEAEVVAVQGCGHVLCSVCYGWKPATIGDRIAPPSRKCVLCREGVDWMSTRAVFPCIRHPVRDSVFGEGKSE